MSGLVAELQRDALSRDVAVQDLLRKAKAVAIKLDQSEIQSWLESELNGYSDDQYDQIPTYRHIRTELKGFNPYRGWLPIMLGDDDLDRIVNTRRLSQSAASLNHLVDSQGNNGPLALNLTPKNLTLMQQAIGEETDIRGFIERSAIIAILDAVRTRVLDWALELERRNVHGDDMSFSPAEKTAAATVTIANIENFSAGAIGSVASGAMINVNQTVGVKPEAIGLIVSLIADLQAKQTDAAVFDVLRPEIEEIKRELSGQRSPTAIKAALTSMKTILEGAAGSTVATAAPAIAEFTHRLATIIGLI